ncbi:MAG TPA: VOC family protein [Beijerinckiaceae bacterium]|nr:VOC family protein [Beijerinckiaceae bacterium]
MSSAVRAGAYLHHIQLESSDPARLADFYAQALDMTCTKLGAHWLCEGPSRRILFAQGRDKSLGFGAFACRDAEALEEVRSQAQRHGVALSPSPSPLFQDEAFCVRDPDGNAIVMGVAAQQVRPKGLRGPIQHLTLATRDPKAIERFYVEALGFMVSDRVLADDGVVNTTFMRSNHEHHTLACFRQERTGVDHHSYEAGDWAIMKDWCDRMGALRIPIIWGPGRHGPGDNIFIFIEDPDGNWIEVSAELEVVHDRPVKHWRHEPRTLNSWGPAIMRI